MEIASYACYAVGAALLALGIASFLVQLSPRLRRAAEILLPSRHLAVRETSKSRDRRCTLS
jgi:hypothetical protein